MSATSTKQRLILIVVLVLAVVSSIALVLVLLLARPVAERLSARRQPVAAAPMAPTRPGEVIATRVFTGADDFVVDVFHNGQRIPDTARQMTREHYGAVGERIDLTVREGDWLVFNVVNNRLRWNGAYYFGVAGVNDDGWIGISSDESEHWSVCEDPGQVPRFIAEPEFLATNYAQRIAEPWAGGDPMIRAHVKNWTGSAIWGAPTNRNVWIKFRAPSPK